MLVKFQLDPSKKKSTIIDELITLAVNAIQPLLDTANKVSKKQLQERAFYNVPVATVNGALKSKYVNSAQNQAYLNLQNGVQASMHTLFDGYHTINQCSTVDGQKIWSVKSFADVASKNAIKPLMQTIRAIYDNRIDRAIFANRQYINLISDRVIQSHFRSFIQPFTNNQTVHIGMEAVQDVGLYLTEYAHNNNDDVTAFFNQFTNNFDENKELLNSIWYDCNIKRYKNTPNRFISKDGIYQVNDDKIIQKYRFRSHLFGNEYFTDSAFISNDGKYICVLQYRSVLDVAYTSVNASIEKHRRSYTSNESFVSLNNKNDESEQSVFDYIGYTDNGFVACENQSFYKSVYHALMNKRVKRSTAKTFANMLALQIEKGATKAELQAVGGISYSHFKALFNQYLPTLQALLNGERSTTPEQKTSVKRSTAKILVNCEFSTTAEISARYEKWRTEKNHTLYWNSPAYWS